MPSRIAGIAVCFAVLVALASFALHAGPREFATREDARLRAHFVWVGAMLARSDVSALTPHQRGARAEQIRELRAYASTGAFPRNRSESSGRTPIFVARDGNRCAMAHLIEHSGNGALMARVARTANLAYIRDLAGDPELVAWLNRVGMSVAEAAMIQPSYNNYPYNQDDDTPNDGLMTASTILAVGMCGPAIVLSLNHANRSWEQRKSDIALGTVAGAAVAAVGIADWANDSHLRGKGYFSLTIGLTTVLLSQMNLWSGPSSSRAGAGSSIRTGLRVGVDGDPQLAVRVAF